MVFKIFGHKREEIVGGERNFIVIGVIKSRRLSGQDMSHGSDEKCIRNFI